MKDRNVQVDEYIANAESWKRDNLLAFRKLVHQAEPETEEAFKWDVPVFMKNGRLVCAMSTFSNHTKYNFFEGAAINDEHQLFNNGLTSKKSRSIDLVEGAAVDQFKLAELLKSAFARVA